MVLYERALRDESMKRKASTILVTGAPGRVGGVGRTVAELLLKQGKPVRGYHRMSTHARSMT